MSSQRILKPTFEHSDERGVLREVATGNWKTLNFASRRKGSIVGNHYHKVMEESFYIISGSANVKLINVNIGEVNEFLVKQGDCFRVHPYEAHALLILEDLEMVTLLSEIFNKDSQDIYKYEVLTK